MMLWALLLGCSDELALDELQAAAEDPTIGSEGLVLQAFPAISVDADGSTRALPVVLRDLAFDERPTLSLLRPFPLLGSVTGRTSVPLQRASLPGLDTLVPALVDLDADATDATVRVGSDRTEGFATDVVAGEHIVTVLPEDPLLGIASFAAALQVDGPDLDISVDQGVPVWGRVTFGTLPRAGASVQLRTDRGLLGAATRTDARGWYELRSAIGMTVEVVTSGDDGIAPMLSGPAVRVTEQGARVDLAYSATPPATLSMRVVAPDGTGQRLMPYRLRSIALNDYGEEASVEQTGFADTSGNIVTQAIQGSYVLELLVQGQSALSGQEIDVEIQGPTSLGTIRLDDFTALSGRVSDERAPVVDATVTCIERALARRRWSTTTDSLGAYSLDVPTSALTCVVLPPDDRPDLASDRFDVERPDEPVDIVLNGGRLLTGTVVLEGDPEVFALLEVRDADGVLVGNDLTDARGEYAIRVQP